MCSNTHDYSVVNCLIPCILYIMNLDQCVVLPEKNCFVDLLFILRTVSCWSLIHTLEHKNNMSMSFLMSENI